MKGLEFVDSGPLSYYGKKSDSINLREFGNRGEV